LGNAGSFFRNPVVHEYKANKIIKKFPGIPHFQDKNSHTKFSAAWLIDQCGWKGKRTGDAGVYSKHALILVNYGKASGRDIYDLSEKMKESVYKKFKLLLDREVLVVG
jgi:UDP-N-acetylmuramate dehydrogenase